MTPEVTSPLAAYKLPLQKGASPMKSPYKLPQVHTGGCSSSPGPADRRGAIGYRLPSAAQASSPGPSSFGSTQLNDDSSTAASSQHGSEASSNASASDMASSSDCQPRLVDAAGASEALRMRRQVIVSASYRSRVAPTERTLSEGGIGIIVKTYDLGEGHTADVIWDCGKVLQGYCIGFRGLHDLEYAPVRTPSKDQKLSLGAGRKLDYSPQPEVQRKVARGESIEGDIKVHVGYMGNAPKVEYQKPKAIWSGGGPIDYKDPSA
eukprot:CAMPEP_0114115566 /NCGR_PEP_ID=MMETSP0043_2-20121206/4037_1 /TAXON_ID=464988 /ORGANISM="Hemiselmis andersenii, Strain CCMP644" /LENGTH=263 /DNA_ID=CAMNT_0001207837 /DNA_START=121 /DNA_END=912 /DNA_ORIENTATION=+